MCCYKNKKTKQNAIQKIQKVAVKKRRTEIDGTHSFTHSLAWGLGAEGGVDNPDAEVQR